MSPSGDNVPFQVFKLFIRKSLIKSWKENRKISQEHREAQRKHYGIFYKLLEKIKKPKEFFNR